MQVHFDLALLPSFKNAVITTGTFDGIHMAHRQLIQLIQNKAAQLQGESVLITFHPHPQLVLSDKRGELKLISTLEEKIELLKPLGIDHLVVVPFTAAFADMSAEAYISDFLIKYFHPKAIIIGFNHRFGHGRKGDVHLLEAYGLQHDFVVYQLDQQTDDAIAISSTRIRKALLSGHPEEATALLGRPYRFSGTVVKGDQLGRTIGFPTANLAIADPNKLIPANGVYAVSAFVGKTAYKAMMNIGTRPTFDGHQLRIEVHLLDFDGDLYGQELTVAVKKWVRAEQKFAGKEALIAQLQADRAFAAQA